MVAVLTEAQQHTAPRIAAGEVSLRPLGWGDASRIRRWMTDPELIRLTVLVPGPEYMPARPFTPAAADRYLASLLDRAQRRSFAILRDGVHVGNVGLKAVELTRLRAECFIEIGERSARGCGVGREAMQLLLRFAFDRLGLEEVRLGVFEFNAPAIRLYRQLGFREGAQYGWHYADGLFYEVLGMVLSRADFRQL